MITRRLLLGAASVFAVATGTVRRAIAQALGKPITPEMRAMADKLGLKAGNTIYFKGDDSYESYREMSVFNARKPPRFPEAIIMAQSVDDVVAGVKLAKENGWQVATRSGGHAWVGSSVRNHAIQINLMMLQELSIDPVAKIATITPSITGTHLNREAAKHNLMTPCAHGVDVGMGGFIMCGGHGWNSGVWGPGCANLMALDVVTADGELIHADEHTNSDYLWAARGSGPGFFGSAVRYFVKLHDKPKAQMVSAYSYSIDDLETVLTWLRNNQDQLPRQMEVNALGIQENGKPTIKLVAAVNADSEEEAKKYLAMLETCPAVSKAVSRTVNTPVSLPPMFEPPSEVQPAGYRFVVDNCWSNAPASEIVPLMREFFTTFVNPKDCVYWLCWHPQKLENMAYSVQGSVYLAANAVYTDEADDAKSDAWCKAAIQKLAKVADGAQMNDENMLLRPTKYLSPEAAKKLEALRAKYDPNHVFAGFLTKESAGTPS